MTASSPSHPHLAGEPTLPEVRMHVVPPAAPVTGTIRASRLCTKSKSASFIRHVEIDVTGTPLAGAFRAGQSFGVVPPGTDGNGKPHKVRLYSLASPTWGEDGHGRVIATTPKRLIAEREPHREGDDPADHRLFLGTCSNHLCDLKPGDPVAVSGPNGKRFVLPTDPNAHDYAFFATGTGIAPFRGFLMELLEGPPEGSPFRAGWTRCTSRIDLFMGSPYTSDLLYDAELRALAAAHPNFTYHPVISRELRPDGTPEGSKGEYVHHYVDRGLERFADLFRSDRTLIYICGLAGMQTGIFSTLGKRGLHRGYLTVADEIAGLDPSEWTDEHFKRRIRATHRCMLEVY
jgi:ferredoxin--NADP+ reductase